MKMVKKFLSVILALMMVLTAMPLTALPAFAVTSGDFEYEVLSEEDKTCEIIDYTGSATELAIPSALDGYTVTGIGHGAFYSYDSLTSVTMPDSVTSIGDEAFEHCDSLTSITVSDSVTSIGIEAFHSCLSLTSIDVASGNPNYSSENGVLFNKDKTELIQYPAGKQDASYTIPNSVTSIGDEAFTYCTSLESITIPDSVTSIGGAAFYYTAYYNNEDNWENDALYIGNYLIETNELSGAYTVKAGTKIIANNVFRECPSLTSITIPDSVTSIGDWAFYDCPSLTSIDVASGNPNYSSENGVLFNKDKTELIEYPASKTETSYAVPNSVTSIDRYAFCECTSLTSIVIPDSVTSIDYDAFFGSGLETIYGYAGSYAETFASEKGYTFVALNDRGDVNGDGSPNSADYSMIKAYAIGNESLDLGQKYVSDLNCDGAVDAYDAIYLDLYLNGYLDTL